MMTASETPGPVTRGGVFLRCARMLLFLFGALSLSYVAITLFRAKLCQKAADTLLDKQISAQEHNPTLSRVIANQGDVLGRIEIPRLGMKIAILEGTSATTLRLGVGHIKGTALPGEQGNSGFAGHRDTFFRTLKDIRTNDEILIQTASGISRYKVDWEKVVDPDNTGVLGPASENSITLVTCYPFHMIGAAPERFVVHANKER